MALWPLAALIIDYLETAGPTPTPVIARDLGEDEAEVERACFWLTFGDDNGYDRMVRGSSHHIYGDRLHTNVRWVWIDDNRESSPLLERRQRAFAASFFASEELDS